MTTGLRRERLPRVKEEQRGQKYTLTRKGYVLLIVKEKSEINISLKIERIRESGNGIRSKVSNKQTIASTALGEIPRQKNQQYR